MTTSQTTRDQQRPRRIQRRRTPGWRMPPAATYVGRPSHWGNIVARLDQPTIWWIDTGGYRHRIDRILTATEVIQQYRIGNGEGWNPDGWAAFGAYAREHLAGRDLACWCPLPEPGQPDLCHGAVLLEVANPQLAHLAR